MQTFKKSLQNSTADDLALPYAVLTGKSAAKVTKAAAVSALVAGFDGKTADCHVEYIGTLSPEKAQAMYFYRGNGYENMNHALRTGHMPFRINTWMISDAISTGLKTSKRDSTLFGTPSGPAKLAKTLLKRSNVDKIIEERVKIDLEDSMRQWEKLSDMIAAVSEAPSRPNDCVLWRGERFRDVFHAQKNAQNPSHFHGESMKTLQVGSEFVRKDFSSFSMAVHMACNFAGQGCCLYRLNLPKDAKALVFDPKSEPREFEVVLPPKTKFRVTRKQVVKSEVSAGASMTVYWLDII
jgi:ADP-ribosyltransferase exoenzyme